MKTLFNTNVLFKSNLCVVGQNVSECVREWVSKLNIYVYNVSFIVYKRKTKRRCVLNKTAPRAAFSFWSAKVGFYYHHRHLGQTETQNKFVPLCSGRFFLRLILYTSHILWFHWFYLPLNHGPQNFSFFSLLTISPYLETIDLYNDKHLDRNLLAALCNCLL